MTKQSLGQTLKAINSRVICRRLYKLRRKHLGMLTDEARLLKKFEGHPKNPQEFIATFKQRLRERFFLSDLNKKEFYVNLMTSLGGFDSIMDDADLIHENKYKALGSDMFSFGDKMDWHLDFRSGKRWPLEFYQKISVINTGDRRKEEGEGDTEHADAKIPWEVSRFHQAIWLGKAYWISDSEAHTEKFVSLVNDWIDNNPAGYGVNWHTPMEAAIRAMNLIVGFLFFIGSNRVDDDFFLKFLCALYEHGVYIRYNLERTLRNGNHYISDLVGLVYIGFLFYDTKAGKRWVKFAGGELEKEMATQVYEDGTDYEKSTSYQRLVTELFTAAYILLKLNDFNVSENFQDRLERMFAFLASAAMPEGKTPSIGDADDSRVFRMKSEIDFNDHRDIIALGAALFGRSDFKRRAPDFSELALVLLGSEGFEKFSSLQVSQEDKSMIFKDGGFAFLRTGKDFCSFDFGDIGKRGRGGHGHNDVLSLTISGKNPFLVDRGTYCYTCDAKLRNKLRSTFSHNTAVIDGTEQAEFAGLWSIKKDLTSPELLRWSSNDEQDIVEAQHHAYKQLPQPVTHRRQITFNKHQRTFLIRDDFIGEGKHKIDLMFHFAPSLRVTDVGQNYIVLEGEEFALMKFQHDFVLERWEHSPSYGVLQDAQTARIHVSTDVPISIETFVFILSSIDDANHILNRL